MAEQIADFKKEAWKPMGLESPFLEKNEVCKLKAIFNKHVMLFEMTILKYTESQIGLSVVDEMNSTSHNYHNITATLSTLWGVAQPWRFFYACRKVSGGYSA